MAAFREASSAGMDMGPDDSNDPDACRDGPIDPGWDPTNDPCLDPFSDPGPVTMIDTCLSRPRPRSDPCLEAGLDP